MPRRGPRGDVSLNVMFCYVQQGFATPGHQTPPLATETPSVREVPEGTSPGGVAPTRRPLGGLRAQ